MALLLLKSELLVREGGFLRVTRYTFGLPDENAPAAKPEAREHIDVYRRDSAAGLVHVVDADVVSAKRHQLLLVRQKRYSTIIRGDIGEPDLARDPMFIELPAGVVEAGEPPMETFRREVEEETGARVDPVRVRHIVSYYPSPGACSEKIHLYHSVLPASALPDLRGERGADAFENISVMLVTVEDFLRDVANGAVEDSKALVAAEWLRRQDLEEIGRMT
ncbi:MAG: NUDIX domain-containing protein [Alphaproteobacteria bacterium]|nr:NUDIX domain-containing protein [Alphaproteobacteria bacterium]